MKSPIELTVVGILWAGFGLSPLQAQSVGPASVLAGVYNEAQAQRGQTLYYANCLQCHGETMAGVDKAPPLAGPQFGSTWNNSPLAALVARIQTMPPDKPGSMSLEQSVDLLAYVLWYNGLPPGADPLGTDAARLAKLKFQLPSAGN